MSNSVLHRAETRGHADHGWLDTYHTFSFAGYHDPNRLRFGLLRVLNDDLIMGGTGFGSHPHDNMEIISIPIFGALRHRDSMGNEAVINKNDIQIMSAGSGIVHSEFNANNDEPANFLQIWIYPKVKNIQPRYDQRTFDPNDRVNKLVTVVAPNEENAVKINQDAWLSLSNLEKDFSISYQLHLPSNGVYIFVIHGQIEVLNQTLNRRDGYGISGVESFSIKALANSELLLIEVPMN